MYLSGFADEADDSLAGQIAVTRELGWNNIEARSVDGVNLHDLDEAGFDKAVRQLSDAGVTVNCLGSTIANWAKPVDEDFGLTMATVERAVKRMKILGTKLVRIMSYAVIMDGDGRAAEDQREEERFRRLREICAPFVENGMIPVHENCMTYGGGNWANSLRLVDNVPGLKLVFDTGNAPLTPDFSQSFPYPMQDSWEFYTHVKKHIAYVHIKDSRHDPVSGKERYFFPGEGDGQVERIVRDLLADGYDGGFSIEPHMEVVFHDAAVSSEGQKRRDNYIEYGRRFMKMLADSGCSAVK